MTRTRQHAILVKNGIFVLSDEVSWLKGNNELRRREKKNVAKF